MTRIVINFVFSLLPEVRGFQVGLQSERASFLWCIASAEFDYIRNSLRLLHFHGLEYRVDQEDPPGLERLTQEDP